MIRSNMIRILLGREVRRLQKNPSALMLIGLLSAVALLIATSRPVTERSGAGSSQRSARLDVYLIVDEPYSWLSSLPQRTPDGVVVSIVNRQLVPVANGKLQIPPGRHAVEMRSKVLPDQTVQISLLGRYRGKDPAVLDPFWKWFWPALASIQSGGASFAQDAEPLGGPASGPAKSLEETSVADLVKTELIGTCLVLMVEFFACCHLLVSFTSQDRERGTLSALVLSPARLSEILLARYLFHLALSLGGSVAIVAILQPLALGQPLLWVVMLLTSFGLMSVGTCIATLVKTQASAALLALCYMLAGAVLFYLSSSFHSVAMVRLLAFENYSFPLLYVTLKGPVQLVAAPGLLNMTLLVGIWMVAARSCFYRYGWR